MTTFFIYLMFAVVWVALVHQLRFLPIRNLVIALSCVIVIECLGIVIGATA